MPERKTRSWIIWVYLVLLVVGIPWYWPADNITIFLGIPLWVLTSLFVVFIGSIFTAYLFLVDPTDPGESDNDS